MRRAWRRIARCERPHPFPQRIGPIEFGALGNWVTVRCPRDDYDILMRNAGGQWEPGSRRWLIERRRIGPVIRALDRNVDPLFRAAGIILD
jgi:hypothetical protein